MRLRPACLFPKWLLILAPGLLAAVNANAAGWNARASFTPGLTYTDNVCLTKGNKQGDWSGVAMLTPSGSVSHESRRVKVKASGSVNINTLTNSELRDNGCNGSGFDDRERFYPTFNASASGMIIPETLNLNASGRAGQNELTSSLPTGNDPLNRNTNTYYIYSIGPTYNQKYGSTAKSTLSYKYDEVINSSDVKRDSSRHSVVANLLNGSASQISWGLLGRYRKTSYSDVVVDIEDDLPVFRSRKDTELSSARLKLGYQVNRSWQVNGTYGWEFNSFQTARDVDTDGNAWDIGIRWTPSPRTSVSIGSGDRFFGSTPRLNAVHQYKRSTFNASYIKKITYERDISTQEDGLIPGYDNSSSLAGNSPILDERFSLGYTHNGRRAITNVSGSYSKQIRAEDGQKGEFKSLAVAYSPQISEKYSVTGTVAWNQSDPRGRFGQSDLGPKNSTTSWRTSISLSRPLNQRVSLSGNYSFTDTQSDNAFGGYRENRFTMAVQISL